MSLVSDMAYLRPAERQVIVLIPAYRPGAALPETIRRLRDADGWNCIRSIVVVDDGSGSGFAEVFGKVADYDRVTVLRHAVNLGKGAALKTGFNHVLLTNPDVAGVVTADADGQHAVADILRVSERLSKESGRIVLGTRAFSGGVPFRSKLGNVLTALIFRILTGTRIADSQTGLRGWPIAYCRQVLPIAINGYDFELECLLRAHSRSGRGFTIVQVPIATIYEDGNRSSHFSPVRDSMRIYFVLLRYCGAGLFVAFVDSLVFSIAHNATSDIALSQLAGRSVAVVIAFVIARNIVFRSDARLLTSLVKYLAVVLTLGLLSFASINFLHQMFGVAVLAAKLWAEALLFLASFAIQRELIFVSRGANKDEA